MPATTFAFLGDIVAGPGRRIVETWLPALRGDHAPDIVVANAENAAHGSGLSARQYRELRALGIDGITLGDHAFREPSIRPVLEEPEARVIRPLNLSPRAGGRTVLRFPPPPGRRRGVAVITVLGRIFMALPADDPFRAVDDLIAALGNAEPVTIIVEAHMEATSEKAALAHHLDGRVAAVLGTHTHVPTADARILPGGTAFITDVGMCGPYDSCIGRDKSAVVRYMTTGVFQAYGIGAGDERLCAAVVSLSDDTGLALAIRRVEYPPPPASLPGPAPHPAA